MARNFEGLLLRLVELPRGLRKSIVIASDLVVCLVSVWIAYWLRIGEWELFTPRVVIFAAIACGTWVAVSLGMRTYRSVTRFAGAYTISSLVQACALMSLVLGIVLLTARIDSVPRTLSVVHPLVFFMLLTGERTIIAQLMRDALQGLRHGPAAKPVLIYGAGVTAQQLAASIRNDPSLKLVGYVDQNAGLRDSYLEGRPIWHTADLEMVLETGAIDEVFLALPSAKRSVRRAIVERVRNCDSKIRVRVLPSFSQIASGRVSVSDLREVQIEELLGRDEVPPAPELIERNITGLRVLVTGAGGSIGSELCRQIIRLRPKVLVLAEISEHALYQIDLELREALKAEKLTCQLHTELTNIADRAQCERLLLNFRPDTVFHAAAYKHVPLVEINPLAGIRNNVMGTLSIALAAEKAGVSNFILISTDKAVRPTNVMGASKRACELIVQARAAAQQRTTYTSVRFGNVLGSSGSVIPRFRKQIRVGGPVTITHRQATRYFMTIPEAAQLVIQAGALASQGEVLLLDMGEPVCILDLARSMVELSGLTVADEDNPDGDILIEEIGLRPGEKLVEELLISADSEGTEHPRIIKARETMIEWAALEPLLAELQQALDTADTAGAIRCLKILVPEFSGGDDLGPERPDFDTVRTLLGRQMLGSA